MRLHAVSCVCAIFAVGLGLTAQAGELSVRIGSDNWHYAASELRFLQRAPFWGEESAEPTVADPLPALQQIAALAEDAGIQFLLVPVPPKALIYPEPIGLTTAQTVRSHALLDAFFAELRARGIHALDLRPTFLARRTEPALYARTDRHWSGTGLQCTAEAVARRLRERGWTRDPLSGVRRLEKNITFTGDLARRADSSRQETMPVTVLTDEAGLVYAPDPTSSVILMGDRHLLVYHDGQECSGAGFPDHLARELGRPVDLIAASEQAPAVVRSRLLERLREKPAPPETWCIIWCFAFSDLTEAPGWDPLPHR